MNVSFGIATDWCAGMLLLQQHVQNTKNALCDAHKAVHGSSHDLV